ncbi:MAG: hypothetical protein K6T31_06065 [Alicyclobacillus sp.]|nr:hypothetical protein [Alicyclobacillus sp.]
MKAHLDERLPDAANRVRVYGFVHDVWELMAVSDLMLTKAGGLTISEALALQLPMLLYRPIPGQEVQNAKFLVRQGVAVLARNRREVSKHLLDLLLVHPEKRQHMRLQAQQIRLLHAAERIAGSLMALASRQQSRAHYSYQH